MYVLDLITSSRHYSSLTTGFQDVIYLGSDVHEGNRVDLVDQFGRRQRKLSNPTKVEKSSFTPRFSL